MRNLTFILLFLFCLPVFASPIFFKCDQQGQMSEFLTGKEVLQGLEKMQTLMGGNKTKLYDALCEGRTECEKTLTQVLALNKISDESAKAQRDELLVKLRSQMNASPIVKANQAAFDLEKKIRDSSAEVAACRQTLVSLKPDDWVKNDCVTFYYPFKSEYTYASGFKFRNGKLEKQGCAKSQDLQAAIRKALIMGVDPAMYLSIGLMEGGFKGWEGLYLDPIGIMKSLGCPETKSDVTKHGEGKLHSYGNSHKISPILIKDPKLSERMQTYLKTLPGEVKAGKQYYCADVSSGGTTVLEQADPKKCCMEMNFVSQNHHGMKEAFVQHYMYKMRSQRPYGSSDPAFRMQAFNGFTKLMGGAESVSVFRSGIDYTKQPAYGYQSMDYILNNLAANPWLVREIESQKKALNLKENPPSILCEGSSAGPHYIDSRHYFNLHRNSIRMSSILNKPYNEMTERQKKVINGEIDHMLQKGLFPDTINGKSLPKVNSVTNYKPIKFGVETSEGKKDSFENSAYGYGESNQTKNLSHFIKAEELTNGFTFESKDLSYVMSGLDGKPLKLTQGSTMFEIPGYMIMLTLPTTATYSDGTVIKTEGFGSQKCFEANKKETDCHKLFQSGIMYKNVSVVNDKGEGYKVDFKKTPANTSQGMYGSTAVLNSVVDNKVTFNDGKSWVHWKTEQSQDEKKEASSSLPEASRAELVSYYFKNLHKGRSTIEKASYFGTWKDMTDEDIQTMSDALNSSSKSGVIESGNQPVQIQTDANIGLQGN